VRGPGGHREHAGARLLAFSAPRDSDGDGLLDQAGGQGRKVRLTTDPTQDRFDRYRRLLAYVRTSGTFINEAQIASGWTSVYVYQGKAFRELGRFRGAQGVARAAGRGVWVSASCAESTFVSSRDAASPTK
jgi:endonuclease YncB( thermonuclease family)